MLVGILLSLAIGVAGQTSCDYELILVSNAMGNFNSKAYNHPSLTSYSHSSMNFKPQS